MFTTHALRRSSVAGLAALVLGGLALTACGDYVPPASDAKVSRIAYGQTDPANAPGQTLYLHQVTIPAGVALPKHHHEGTQVATIQAGDLTYHVEENTVTVNHADGTSEQVSAPAVIVLHPGDGLVEPEDMVHWAENKGTVPVVILLTSLLTKDAPLSTPVD